MKLQELRGRITMKVVKNVSIFSKAVAVSLVTVIVSNPKFIKTSYPLT